MADIAFNMTRKGLKIAQIAQPNQLFQLLHLVHIYDHGFYEFMRRNVNNDVSKDSPVETLFFNMTLKSVDCSSTAFKLFQSLPV